MRERLQTFAEVEAAPKVAFVSDDPQQILQFALDSYESGLGAALVTLVEIRGGAARALGSQMAVRGDALHCGYVSGGCTEAAVAAEAVAAIASGFDRYLRLGEGSKFFDIVLPCGGGITVAIHVIRQAKSLRTALTQLERRDRVGLIYDPASQSLAAVLSATRSMWEGGCFVTSYRPKTKVVFSGGAIEVETAAGLARACGYSVCTDYGFSFTSQPKLADVIDMDTAVVILHHDLDREIPALKGALAANPFYIGALGSRRTHERRSAALQSLGYKPSDIARIKAPIGLFAKARDATSLALSVLGDIAAARATSI
ncbi:xanthine dehydrogenase accessory factor [Rhizobium sp. PP-F2F-G36]|nr:xanthine dehydrogenase accessory factor [Rhizobium sp. PP-F2F-G36]